MILLLGLIALAQASYREGPSFQKWGRYSPFQRQYNDFDFDQQDMRRGFFDHFNRFGDYDRFDYDRNGMTGQYPYGFGGFDRQGDFDRQNMRRGFSNRYNRFANAGRY